MDYVAIIQEAIDETGTCTMSTDYSGRSMYGATCVSITGTRTGCMQTIASSIKIASQVALETDEFGEFDVFVDAIMNFMTDRMGYDDVVYWPTIH